MLRMPTRSNPADAEELIGHGNAAAGTRYRDRRARATVGWRAGACAGELIVAVAGITHIHGNLPPLQAALARIDQLRIERIFCGGGSRRHRTPPQQGRAAV